MSAQILKFNPEWHHGASCVTRIVVGNVNLQIICDSHRSTANAGQSWVGVEKAEIPRGEKAAAFCPPEEGTE